LWLFLFKFLNSFSVYGSYGLWRCHFILVMVMLEQMYTSPNLFSGDRSYDFVLVCLHGHKGTGSSNTTICDHSVMQILEALLLRKEVIMMNGALHIH
jgi:hypothetical protein